MIPMTNGRGAPGSGGDGLKRLFHDDEFCATPKGRAEGCAEGRVCDTPVGCVFLWVLEVLSVMSFLLACNGALGLGVVWWFNNRGFEGLRLVVQYWTGGAF